MCYYHINRKWDVLPEVMAKNKKSVKEKEAETNRLRVKIYQKVTNNCLFTCIYLI